jgi:uncharacterized membrane protein
MINTSTISTLSRLLWTGILLGAGLAHVVQPEAFVAYYPTYLPWPQVAIYASAVVEWLLAVMLWSTMQRAAWFAIAALMLIYVPVHVFVITHHETVVSPPVAIPLWLAWVRLPMQFLLIGWAWWLGRRKTV